MPEPESEGEELESDIQQTGVSAIPRIMRCNLDDDDQTDQTARPGLTMSSVK